MGVIHNLMQIVFSTRKKYNRPISRPITTFILNPHIEKRKVIDYAHAYGRIDKFVKKSKEPDFIILARDWRDRIQKAYQSRVTMNIIVTYEEIFSEIGDDPQFLRMAARSLWHSKNGLRSAL